MLGVLCEHNCKTGVNFINADIIQVYNFAGLYIFEPCHFSMKIQDDFLLNNCSV